MNKARIKANLYLYAVLPRLEELAKLDDEARRIAGELDLVVQFVVNAGPAVQIAIKNGEIKAHRGKVVKPGVALFFHSCDQLVRMFNQETVIPIPYRGFTKLPLMKKFTRLTEILTRYLEPSDEDLKDPKFKAAHVEMSLMVGMAGAREIADLDPKMQKVVKKLPNGTLLFRVEGGPSAHVIVDNRRIFALNGPISDPVGTLTLKNVDIAADVMAKKVDTFAALGIGDIKVSGLIPLVDEFNALMDRVSYFLMK